MVLESNKYKKRLIILCILIIFSLLLAIPVEKTIKQEADKAEEIIEVIQSTPEEEYNRQIEERAAKEGKDKSEYTTKQEVLDTMHKIAEPYEQLYKYKYSTIIILFTVSISAPLVGIMMYFIFTNWIINKVFKDIKKWLSILMRILALVILLPIIGYVIIIVGLFGEIPFIVYTLYKYIKIKKSEDKDDVIKNL